MNAPPIDTSVVYPRQRLPDLGVARACFLLAVMTQCGLITACESHDREQRTPEPAAHVQVEQLLKPADLAKALLQAGPLTITSETVLETETAGDASQSVVTNAEIRIDNQGNIHLFEENSLDGGREIYAVDDAMAVALRYGKLIERKRDEQWLETILAEAVGGPWAAWEVMRGQTVTTHDSKSHTVTIGFAEASNGSKNSKSAKNSKPTEEPTEEPSPEPSAPATTANSASTTARPSLRAWRDTIQLEQATGRITVSDPTGASKTPPALASAELEARFRASHSETVVQGHIRAQLRVSVPSGSDSDRVSMPETREPLWLGQRTAQEARELLRDLPGRRDPAKL